MRGDALFEPAQPLVEAEHREVAVGQRRGARVDDVADAGALVGGR